MCPLLRSHVFAKESNIQQYNQRVLCHLMDQHSSSQTLWYLEPFLKAVSRSPTGTDAKSGIAPAHAWSGPELSSKLNTSEELEQKGNKEGEPLTGKVEAAHEQTRHEQTSKPGMSKPWANQMSALATTYGVLLDPKKVSGSLRVHRSTLWETLAWTIYCSIKLSCLRKLPLTSQSTGSPQSACCRSWLADGPQDVRQTIFPSWTWRCQESNLGMQSKNPTTELPSLTRPLVQLQLNLQSYTHMEVSSVERNMVYFWVEMHRGILLRDSSECICARGQNIKNEAAPQKPTQWSCHSAGNGITHFDQKQNSQERGSTLFQARSSPHSPPFYCTVH